jgi:hypothetical protein
VWHILDVYPQSPASNAGLEAHTDYIVGGDVLFNSSEDFYTLIRGSIGKSVPLYVYSSITNRVRLVEIEPNRTWGGNGCLGCDVGYGYIHRIPSPPIEEVSLPQSIPNVNPMINLSPITTVVHTPSILPPGSPEFMDIGSGISFGSTKEMNGENKKQYVSETVSDKGVENKGSKELTSGTSIVF